MVTVKEDIDYFLNRKSINIDIGFRCSLECPKCQRQSQHKNLNEKVPGYDLTLDEIYKLSDFYKEFVFCGQLSDAVHHPQFIEKLEFCRDNKVGVEIHNASSTKSKEWYIKAFKANRFARWVFGIDGLPEQSHLYRKNQDGIKLLEMMQIFPKDAPLELNYDLE